jgi:CRISPR system Cascade subunit CasD
MAQWLVIALQAPFASFADAPGNAERKTTDMPSRSALIGLAGAALGVRRDDRAGQSALSRALVTAAAQMSAGEILSDFHTFQSLNQAAKGARTRADALTKTARIETSVTRREYRMDGLWQAAYRLTETPGALTLDALAQAFRQPYFTLCVGRRACPPSHPLNPLTFEAADVRAAFAGHAAQTAVLRNRAPLVLSLEDPGDAPGAPVLAQHARRDDPLDRVNGWTFGERREWRIAGDAGRAP